MNIVQNLVSKDKYNIKCPYSMTPTRIVVHNTANDASARNEIAYMIGNNQEVSFHYAVDDKEVVQGIPENRNAWHCGDGANGKGNREGVAIEICYSKSGGDRFTQAEKNAVELIVSILKKYNWEANTVRNREEIKTLVDSFLSNIKQGDGLYDFKTVMDTTNNTNEVIDRNMGVIDIYVEVVRGLEILAQRLTVLKTGSIESGDFE